MKEVKLGKCGVDSGQVLIIDPCYINTEWEKETGKGRFGGGTYEKCCKLTLSKKSGGQLKYKRGHAGLGVVASTGYGDGTYPVYGTINEEGRVTELRIVFDEDKGE